MQECETGNTRMRNASLLDVNVFCDDSNSVISLNKTGPKKIR